MTRIACKFGGSSLADAGQFQKVRAIVEADARRRVIVPSAPGKRDSSDAKLTDLLYLCQDSAAVGAPFHEPFARIRDRFLEIEHSLGIRADMGRHLDKLAAELGSGLSRDHVASRGEYLNGLLLAAYLEAEFVDPVECVVLTPNGNIDPQTYELLGARLANVERRYVMPGFYGRDARGQVKTFSRGGSDISGAIAARAGGCELYENWTDVSGMLMTDPRIVPEARPMEEVTYAEIRELSYMGASVLHDEAIAPVRAVGLPVCIRNTNAPDHPGTRIVQKLSDHVEKATEIAGIAGKRAFSMISLEKNLMNKEVGFVYRLLGILERHGISLEHIPSSIDSVSVVVDQAALEGKAELVMREIQETLHPDRLDLTPAISLIAVVGEGMAHQVGIAAKVFLALRDASVNVRLIDQGSSEKNIIVGVVPEDYEKAIRAIYDRFVVAADGRDDVAR